MTSGEVEQHVPVPAPRARRPSLEEQAQEKGTQPIGNGEFYAREELFAEPGLGELGWRNDRWITSHSTPTSRPN